MLMLGKFITQFYQMCQTWMKITRNIQIDENLQVLGVFFGYNERCVFGYNERFQDGFLRTSHLKPSWNLHLSVWVFRVEMRGV